MCKIFKHSFKYFILKEQAIPFNVFYLIFSIDIQVVKFVYFLFSLGIEDGQTIRILVNRNEVFVTFKVEKSDYFRRDGSDIHTDAKISISQAILGGTIRVRGIYDDHTVQVLFLNCV